jgi:hypothetical protein
MLFFSSVADKMPAKNKFFCQSFHAYSFEGTLLQDKKSKRSHKIFEITALWVYAY